MVIFEQLQFIVILALFDSAHSSILYYTNAMSNREKI